MFGKGCKNMNLCTLVEWKVAISFTITSLLGCVLRGRRRGRGSSGGGYYAFAVFVAYSAMAVNFGGWPVEGNRLLCKALKEPMDVVSSPF
jgi:hypothetical protein